MVLQTVVHSIHTLDHIHYIVDQVLHRKILLKLIWEVYYIQTFVIYTIGGSPCRTKVVGITFTHALCIAMGIAPAYFIIASLVTI